MFHVLQYQQQHCLCQHQRCTGACSAHSSYAITEPSLDSHQTAGQAEGVPPAHATLDHGGQSSVAHVLHSHQSSELLLCVGSGCVSCELPGAATMCAATSAATRSARLLLATQVLEAENVAQAHAAKQIDDFRSGDILEVTVVSDWKTCSGQRTVVQVHARCTSAVLHAFQVCPVAAAGDCAPPAPQCMIGHLHQQLCMASAGGARG